MVSRETIVDMIGGTLIGLLAVAIFVFALVNA